MTMKKVAILVAVMFFLAFGHVLSLSAAEPPAMNPFQKKPSAANQGKADDAKELNPFAPIVPERKDSVPGHIEMSDGTIYFGLLYLTRDKRLQLYDANVERQREIPLTALKKIDCTVKKEWMEKEWRFKELASDEKYFTGREYPSREYVHKLTLRDGRTIEGPMDGLVYIQMLEKGETSAVGVRPEREETTTKKILLHKRQRGEFEEKLADLKYAKVIEIGEEALETGAKKAAEFEKKKANTGGRPEVGGRRQ